MNRPVITNGKESENREGLFASTRWTLILAAGDADAPSTQSLSALSELCRIYWRPIYLFVRREGYRPDDAQDLTQGFFAHLIETRAYARAEETRGRFRSFLLGTLKHFVANTRDRDNAQKRGGSAISIPINEETLREVEAGAAYNETWSADRVYERAWATALLQRAFERLDQECALAGKSALFDSLKVHLSGTNGASVGYEELSSRLHRPAVTLRSDLARMRARYRAILREEVQVTVEESSEVDDELRYLCRVMAAD